MISPEQAFRMIVKYNIIVIHCDNDQTVFTDCLGYTEYWIHDGNKTAATLRLIERVARDRGEPL